MAATRKASKPVTFTLNITKYDLVIYSGQQGTPPTNGNINGTDLAVMTLVGTCQETPKRVVFYIRFLPTGSNIRPPSFSQVGAAIRVELEMDASQLWGACGVMQSIPHCAAIYDESSGKPKAQLTTTYGA